MLAELLTPQQGPKSSASASSAPNATAPGPLVACFSITATADPSVMPRVLELFAKRD